MTIVRALGWTFVAASCAFGIRTWWLDQQLQQFRASNASPAAFALVPVRWQPRFYTPEGRPLISRAWRAMAWMCALAILGMIFLGVSAR